MTQQDPAGPGAPCRRQEGLGSRLHWPWGRRTWSVGLCRQERGWEPIVGGQRVWGRESWPLKGVAGHRRGPCGGSAPPCLTALFPVRPGSPRSEGLTVLSGHAWGSPSASFRPGPPCAKASTHLFLGRRTPEPHTFQLHYHGPHPRPHICPLPRPRQATVGHSGGCPSVILIPDPQGRVLAHRLRQGVEQDGGHLPAR